jgi:hypothetical protein
MGIPLTGSVSAEWDADACRLLVKHFA